MFVTEQVSVAPQNVTCAFPTMLVYTVMNAVLVYTNHLRIVFLVSVMGMQTLKARPKFATLKLATAYDVPITLPDPGAISVLQASLGTPRHITAPVQVSPHCNVAS